MMNRNKIGGLFTTVKLLKGTGFIAAFVAILGGLTYFSSPSRYISAIEVNPTMGYAEYAEGVYTGELLGQIREGTGEFSFDTGETYSGLWESNLSCSRCERIN